MGRERHVRVRRRLRQGRWLAGSVEAGRRYMVPRRGGVPKSPKVAANPNARELAKIKDYATAQGWDVKPTSNGWAFMAPKDKVPEGRSGIVHTHESPSDKRALKKFVRDLKNHGGLIWPPEKARLQQEKQIDLTTPVHDSKSCLESKGFSTDGFGPDDLDELDQMAHNEERGVA